MEEEWAEERGKKAGGVEAESVEVAQGCEGRMGRGSTEHGQPEWRYDRTKRETYRSE